MDKHAQALQKLQKLEMLYIPFSKATKLPFVECSPVTFDDQVYIYDSEETGKGPVQELNDKNYPVELVRIEKKAMGSLYMNLKLMGVNAIVFVTTEGTNVYQFDQIVKTSEVKNEEGKPPQINAELQLTLVYFMQELRRPGVNPEDEDRKKKLAEMEEEVGVRLAESTFIMPLFDDPDAAGDQNKKPQIRLLKFGDEQEFQPIFSDLWECNRFLMMQQIKTNVRLVMMPFENLPKALLERAAGFVLNTSTICMRLTRKSMNQ